MRFPGSLFSSVLSLCLSGGLGVAHAAVPQDYDAAILTARNGNPAAAADKLKVWLAADPSNSRILYDLVAVLGMSGQDEDALRYYQEVTGGDAPAYALKAMAASARRARRPEEAEEAYRLLLQKTPDDAEVHAGIAYVRMMQGRDDEALAYVLERLPRSAASYRAEDAPLLVALAELRERRKEWLLAADAYQEVLRFDPAFRYAIRGRVFALSHAGVAHLADRLAAQTPDVFTEEERRKLAHDAVARTILFGEAHLDSGYGRARFATTEAALEADGAVTARFGDSPAARLDRLIALRDRVRMREAVALYQSLVKEGSTIPPYAKAAAADAYLYLEQPEIARDLYRKALAEIRADGGAALPDWEISLMYAYSEAEQFDEAQALADNQAKGMPRLIYTGLPGLEAPNAEATDASLMGARIRLYAERLDEAQRQLAQLRQAAPFNAEIRALWGTLLAARLKPRAALEEFTVLQVDDPQSVDAAVGRGEMLLELNEVEEARQALASLQQAYPENKAVKDFARQMYYREGATLQIDMTLGRGGAESGAESVVDARLYSPPLAGSLGESFRIFSHVSRSSGETEEGVSAERTRIGVGLDYRGRDVTVEAELNRAVDSPVSGGIVLTASWMPSDAWRTELSYDSNANDLAAAAYLAGVTARRWEANLTWIGSESRSIGGGVSQTRFSDDNTRDAATLWWYERWISGPVFKFDSNLAFSTSRNSAADAVYFNPARDREWSLTLGAEWRTWRRYHRSFSQRLSYTAGSYWQEGVGSGGMGDLRYEHLWSDDGHADLRYGIGYGYHPYDGEREYRRYLFLGLNWQIR